MLCYAMYIVQYIYKSHPIHVGEFDNNKQIETETNQQTNEQKKMQKKYIVQVNIPKLIASWHKTQVAKINI